MEENLKKLITSLTDLTDKLADYTLGTAKKRISALGDDPRGALQVEEDDFEKANITREEEEKERRLARAIAEEWFNPNSVTQKRFSKYKKEDDEEESESETPSEEQSDEESKDKKPRAIKKSVMPVEITGMNEKVITSLGKVIGSSIPKLDPQPVVVEKDDGGFLGGLGKWLIPLLAGVAGVAALITGLFGEGEQDMKGVSKMLAKLGLTTAGKAVAKLVGKPILKLGAKVFGWATKFLSPVLKRIPGIGSLISWAFAYDRFQEGDVIGGLIDVASGIASLIPGPGTAIGIGLDILNAWLDYSDTGQEVKENFGNTLAVMTGKVLQFGMKFLKPVLKRIPVVGSLFSFGSAYDRFQKGEYLKGIIDVASGIANFVPGIGTAISIGLDILNAFIDPPSEEEKQNRQTKGFWGGISEWFGELVEKMYKFILDILPEKILGVSVRGRVAKWMGIDGYPIDDDEARKRQAATAQKKEAVAATIALEKTGAIKSSQNIKEVISDAQKAASKAGGYAYKANMSTFEQNMKVAARVAKGDQAKFERALLARYKGEDSKKMLELIAKNYNITYDQMVKQMMSGYDRRETWAADKWKDSMDGMLKSNANVAAGLMLGYKKQQAAVWEMERQFKKDMEINIGGEAISLKQDTSTPSQLKISDTQQLSQKQLDEIDRLQKSKEQGDKWLYETLKRAGIVDAAEKQKQLKLAEDIAKRQAMSPVVDPIIRGEITPQLDLTITGNEDKPPLTETEYNNIKQALTNPVEAPQQKLGPRRDLMSPKSVQAEQRSKPTPKPSTRPPEIKSEVIEIIKPIDYSTWNQPAKDTPQQSTNRLETDTIQPKPRVTTEPQQTKEPLKTSSQYKNDNDELYRLQVKYSKLSGKQIESIQELHSAMTEYYNNTRDTEQLNVDQSTMRKLLNFREGDIKINPVEEQRVNKSLKIRAQEALQAPEIPKIDTTEASDQLKNAEQNIKSAGDAINDGTKKLSDATQGGWPQPSSPYAWDYLRQASANINEGAKKIHKESENFKNDHQSTQIEQNNTLTKKIDLVVQELQAHSQIHSNILETLTTAGLLDKQGETIVNNGGNTNIVNNVEHESSAMSFRDRVVHRLNQTSNKYK